MKRLIIYGSHYGTAKGYAEKMSETTGIPVVNYKDITDLSDYEEVIYFGGLYAGGVKGLKNIAKALPHNTNLIIVTVGLADVTNKENTDHIKKAIYQQVPQHILDRSHIFHLRGGIDYGKLTFAHKTMMSFVYKKAKNTPEEQKTAEVRDMIETYNQKVDFVDYDSLEPIVDFVEKNSKLPHINDIVGEKIKIQFNYEKFEKELLIAVEKYADSNLDKKEDLYIISIDYWPDFTTSIALRANTYSYLSKHSEPSKEDYTYYKYCEEEWDWDIFGNLDELSKELQKYYKELEEKYSDEEYDRIRDKHTMEIVKVCKNVLHKFKKTDTYKEFPKLYLNVYIREFFSAEECIDIFGEVNGENSVEEYERFCLDKETS